MDSTQRDIAGSVAPMSSVGGSRQMLAATPRSRMPVTPEPPHAKYTPPSSGMPNSRTMPQTAIPISRYA